jgi:hypothetical protein
MGLYESKNVGSGDELWWVNGFLPTDFPVSGKVPVVRRMRRATLSGTLAWLITGGFLLGVFRTLNGW